MCDLAGAMKSTTGIFAAPAPAPERSHRAKPPSGEKQRELARCSTITSFFTPPPKPGRPAGLPIKKRGRPAAAVTSMPKIPEKSVPLHAQPLPGAPPKSLGKRAAATMVGATLKRTNWGKGDALERMSKAVSDWEAKAGPILDAYKDLHLSDMPLIEYAQSVQIPYETLQKYVTTNGKRRELGKSVGAKPLFDKDLQGWAVDVIRRYDRGNDGKNKRECIDILHDLKPGLSRKAVQQTFDRTVRPQHKKELTGIVKANCTTVKRTAITVPQQHRWHMTVEQALRWVRERNTGLTPDGKTFGEVIDHFFAGGDETCFLASNGDISIIGDKSKPKHDLPTGSSRTSSTIYRTGTAAGATGPTGFLPPGKQRRAGYSDQFLVSKGAAPGSMIAMTDTGYMTEAAWLEMAPKMGDGLRALPVVRDMPGWWMIKFIDGFGAHTSSAAAMQIYYDRKILLLKEEGDSSHVNQAYDQKEAGRQAVDAHEPRLPPQDQQDQQGHR